MTHFHFLEAQVIHCNRLFCSLENRRADVMDAIAEIDAFKARERAIQRSELALAAPPRLTSKYVFESEQKCFQVAVPAQASKEEARAALYELAVFRWNFHGAAWANKEEPENAEDLPQIFSYVDDYDATIYFFNSLYTSMPRMADTQAFPNTLDASATVDNKVKIPVVKLTPAVAKKLFLNN